MPEINEADMRTFARVVRIHEEPPAIGLMLFKMLEDAKFTREEIRTVARALYRYVDDLPRPLRNVPQRGGAKTLS